MIGLHNAHGVRNHGNIPENICLTHLEGEGGQRLQKLAQYNHHHPSAAVLCHYKSVPEKSPGWWWKFDTYYFIVEFKLTYDNVLLPDKWTHSRISQKLGIDFTPS